jgi:hypothetical protein
METKNLEAAIADLTLPPLVTVVVHDDGCVQIRVALEPFGFPGGASCYCDPVQFRSDAAPEDIGHAILSLSEDMVVAVFQSNVTFGGKRWAGPTNSARSITVNPAPVTMPAPPAPIVHIKVDAPIVHVAPPAFDLPAPVVNIEPAQIHLAPARRVRKRVIRDRDSGLMLGMVEEDEPDAV